MKPLTAKQKEFVHHWQITSNKSEAYRRAFDTANMSGLAVRVEACRLSQMPKITLTLARNQEASRIRCGVSFEMIEDMLYRAYEVAERKGDARSMCLAAMSLGRLHGFI